MLNRDSAIVGQDLILSIINASSTVPQSRITQESKTRQSVSANKVINGIKTITTAKRVIEGLHSDWVWVWVLGWEYRY